MVLKRSSFFIIGAVFFMFANCGPRQVDDTVYGLIGVDTESGSTIEPLEFRNGDFEDWDGSAVATGWRIGFHSDGPTWDDIEQDEFVFTEYRRSFEEHGTGFYSAQLAWEERTYDNPILFQTFAIEGGDTYTFSFWTKSDSGSPGVYAYIRFMSEGLQMVGSSESSEVAVGTSWQQVSVEGTASASAAYALVAVKGQADDYGGSTAGRIYVDDATVTSVPGPEPPSFTTTNYSFDGGCLAVFNNIENNSTGGDSGYGDAVVLSGNVTGVITAKNLGGNASFMIQDNSAGLYFYSSSTGVDYEVGQIVTIAVSQGREYYGLPEVTSYGTITLNDTNTYPLYYQTGDFAQESEVGKVYRYVGSVADGSEDTYFKGQFSGSWYYHAGNSGVEDLIDTGDTGTFTGPVTYTRENFTMELPNEYYFSID